MQFNFKFRKYFPIFLVFLILLSSFHIDSLLAFADVIINDDEPVIYNLDDDYLFEVDVDEIASYDVFEYEEIESGELMESNDEYEIVESEEVVESNDEYEMVESEEPENVDDENIDNEDDDELDYLDKPVHVEDSDSDSDSDSDLSLSNVTVDSENDLRDAIANAPADGTVKTITIADSFNVGGVAIIPPADTNIVLIGDGTPRTITFTGVSNVNLFTLSGNSSSLSLGNNLSLNRSVGNGSIVWVGHASASLYLNGATVQGGVVANGTFIMNDGTVAGGNGVTVGVIGNGNFTMNGGTIDGNNNVAINSNAGWTLNRGTFNGAIVGTGQPTAPSRPGMAVQGFFDATNNQEVTNDLNWVTTNRTIEARWGATVTFDGNGVSLPAENTSRIIHITGANTSGTIAATPGVSMPPNPTRTGYTFAGWFDTNAATGGTQFTSTTLVSANRTVYARWLADVTASFIWNYPGSSTTPFATISIPHGQSITSGATMPSDPIRVGYAFAGWSWDPAGVMPFEPTMNLYSNMFVYAQWTLLPPTITTPVANESFTVMYDNAITAIPIETEGEITTLTVTGLPAGLSYIFDLATGTGQITGTPTDIAQIGNNSTVTIRAENGDGYTERTITINVREFIRIEIPTQMVVWVTDPTTQEVESLVHEIINHSHNTDVELQVGVEPNALELQTNPDNIQLGDQQNELELYLETRTGQRLYFTGSGTSITATGNITQTISPLSSALNNRLAWRFGGEYHGENLNTLRTAGGRLRVHFTPLP